MNSKDVTFAPKLAAVAASSEKAPQARPMPTGPSARRAAIRRLGLVSLIVVALACGLHFGTTARREQERKDRIQHVIQTSGVDSGVVGTGVDVADKGEKQ